MVGMLTHPGRTGKELASETSLKPVATLVIAFGILYGSLFLKSYLAHDYPPPPEELAVWVEHWGEAVMLPFFNIPAEIYRGFQAAIMLPFALALWMLMGGTARQGRCDPCTERGRRAWDTFMTLTETAKKLGVSFYAYLRDRITGEYAIPPCEEIYAIGSKQNHFAARR